MQGKDLSWITERPIAHRGLHDKEAGRLENCRASFEAAIAGNFAIELDVQITRDGKAAVFHDYDLSRLTKAQGLVAEMTLDELARIPMSHGDDHIEELSDILGFVDGRVTVVIELKAPARQDGRLEKRVAEILQAYQGKAVVMSFSPDVLATITPLTDHPRGIVSCDFFKDDDGKQMSEEQRYHLTHLLHASRTRPDFISYGVTSFPAPAVDLMRALYGLPVICWTVRTEEMHHHALKYCDQVTFESYNPDEIS